MVKDPKLSILKVIKEKISELNYKRRIPLLRAYRLKEKKGNF